MQKPEKVKKDPRQAPSTASGAVSARSTASHATTGSNGDPEAKTRKQQKKEFDDDTDGEEPEHESLKPIIPQPINEEEEKEEGLPLNAEPPEELDEEIWNRFLQRRQQQIDKEYQVKQAAKKHYDMQRHLLHLQNVDQAIGQEIRNFFDKRIELAASLVKQALDTEIMLKIRQGQVEIEESPVVTDLKDCEMIEMHIVDDLNQVIRKFGKEKVDVLKDISVSRTAINLLKWTKKKLVLEHKDAVDLTTELQLLRVTKSLQMLIKMGGHDNQKAAELKRLDRKIEFLSVSTREKCLGKKLKVLATKKKVRLQVRENER